MLRCMTKKRRAQIKAMVMAKGGFAALSSRIGWSKEMLYAVIAWGKRRPSVDLGYALKTEFGVEPNEWPKAQRETVTVATSAA